MTQIRFIMGKILHFIKERGADLIDVIFPPNLREEQFEVGDEVYCTHLGDNAVVTHVGKYMPDGGKRVIVEVDAPFQWGKVYRHRVVSNTDHLIKKETYDRECKAQ